jgi:DNA-binding NarL/FixJ family response regulator
MPYSGADVLAHLSELARQRAALPRISGILILAQNISDGELLQSVLRAVVGYDTQIAVSQTLDEAVRSSKTLRPQLGLFLNDSNPPTPSLIHVMRGLRTSQINCPVAVIRDVVTPAIRCEVLELGASDVLTRDEVCGMRLRECLLRLLVSQPVQVPANSNTPVQPPGT